MRSEHNGGYSRQLSQPPQKNWKIIHETHTHHHHLFTIHFSFAHFLHVSMVFYARIKPKEDVPGTEKTGIVLSPLSHSRMDILTLFDAGDLFVFLSRVHCLFVAYPGGLCNLVNDKPVLVVLKDFFPFILSPCPLTTLPHYHTRVALAATISSLEKQTVPSVFLFFIKLVRSSVLRVYATLINESMLPTFHTPTFFKMHNVI